MPLEVGWRLRTLEMCAVEEDVLHVAAAEDCRILSSRSGCVGLEMWWLSTDSPSAFSAALSSSGEFWGDAVGG